MKAKAVKIADGVYWVGLFIGIAEPSTDTEFQVPHTMHIWYLVKKRLY